MGRFKHFLLGCGFLLFALNTGCVSTWYKHHLSAKDADEFAITIESIKVKTWFGNGSKYHQKALNQIRKTLKEKGYPVEVIGGKTSAKDYSGSTALLKVATSWNKTTTNWTGEREQTVGNIRNASGDLVGTINRPVTIHYQTHDYKTQAVASLFFKGRSTPIFEKGALIHADNFAAVISAALSDIPDWNPRKKGSVDSGNYTSKEGFFTCDVPPGWIATNETGRFGYALGVNFQNPRPRSYNFMVRRFDGGGNFSVEGGGSSSDYFGDYGKFASVLQKWSYKNARPTSKSNPRVANRHARRFTLKAPSYNFNQKKIDIGKFGTGGLFNEAVLKSIFPGTHTFVTFNGDRADFYVLSYYSGTNAGTYQSKFEKFVRSFRIIPLPLKTAPKAKKPNAIKETVPSLIQKLEGSSGIEILVDTFKALRRFGHKAEAASPALILIMKDKKRTTMERKIAAEVLGKVNPGTDEAIHALIEGMKLTGKENFTIQFASVHSLGDMGSGAKSAVPALIKAMEYPMIANYAASALGEIGPEAKSAIPALLSVLKDQKKSSYIRKEAAIALGLIGPTAKKAIPVLFEVMKDKNAGQIRVPAAKSLVKFGIPKTDLLPDLIQMLSDRNWQAQWPAAIMLGEMGSEALPAVPALIKALRDSNKGVRQYAARSLGEIGPKARAAIPQLIRALNDTEYSVRMNAARSLGVFGAEAKEAVPLLAKCITDPQKLVGWQATEALGKIGPGAKQAVPALIRALEVKDPEIWSRAITSLGQIGPGAKAAIPALKKMLKTKPGLHKYHKEKIQKTFRTLRGQK